MRHRRPIDRNPTATVGLWLALSLLEPGCAPPQEAKAPAQANDVVHELAKSAAPPPNIVIILADDLGYGDLGSYGSRAIRTPNIDSLAERGVRFTDFHASDSVCTPSRAGLLTGRYAKRMGLDVPLHPGKMSLGQSAAVRFGYLMGSLGVMDLATEGGADGLHADEITLPEALRVAGYTTGMIGKWHLGDFGADPEHNPVEHGFDRFFGVPYSNDMHPFPLFRETEKVLDNVDDQETLTRRYTEEAIHFVESAKDKPFFLYFAHTFPHRPLFASEEFRNRSGGGVFGDAVEEVDWSVGRLLETLDRLGLDRNTLVIFTSDNGPWYDGSPAAFRGRKGQSFEGGHRVPFLARWPSRIPAGAVSHAAAMNIDLFPTCLALAGLGGPDDRAIDGENIADLLIDPDAASPHERLLFYHEGELEGVREGKWKFFRSVNHYVWPLPVNKIAGGMSEHTSGPLPLLFDLELDPGEAYNVADRQPDVVARLTAEMAQWENDMKTNRKGWTR